MGMYAAAVYLLHNHDINPYHDPPPPVPQIGQYWFR